MSAESIITMNLSDIDTGMTRFNETKTDKQATDKLVYSAKINDENKIDNNNINKKNIMDSTPINDIFSGNDNMIQDQIQDPRAAAHIYQPSPHNQRVVANGGGGGVVPPANLNAMNLTDEQIQAIFVGVCAMISFSDPVQDRLVNFIPTFASDTGARSNTGLVVTGLVAAIIFYFGKRVVLK